MTPKTAPGPRRAFAPGRDAMSAAGALAAPLARLILLWIRRAETRRALARLDAERLADVGIGEAEALRECRKPFWRA